MNRLEAMSTLVAAVDAGSFSAAGRKLGLPVATVSRRVSNLESYLKTKLVIRTSRRLELTDAGRSYIVACREILASVYAAEQDAAGEYAAPVGDLTVSAPIVFGRLRLTPVITDFLKSYPDVNVRLVLSDRIASFIEDRIDVALRVGFLSDGGLIATRIGFCRLVVCASEAYLAAHEPRPEKPEDLEKHTCITFEGTASVSHWNFRTAGGDVRAMIRTRLSVNNAEAAVDVAKAGLGITRVLSSQTAGALERGDLVTILDDFEPEPLPIQIVYPEQGLLPLKTRAFLDFAKERLRRPSSGY
ncbi:MAG: LysR family transcriptional regulator [Sneathiella sp.]|mgnify:CR=1 FL=1|jgi:DNA-binding transcriptional LysR family regulator|uniref:LysR family transcriptional regulator n=1 Tax=Sneathiella sp. TaxID=1964365 RepID=UPI000C628D1E|nr:LysR family transcriptional regulator [Sneathiella sp.]MAL80752.1 LysR family transcriptional regulator [Sneathiella sp.]|tara:strand:+ start:973 stop:1875 length:903 start_codon:yes stop_codon:yes gene_type:complete